MAEKKDYESEWKAAYKVLEEKGKEFKISCFQFQKVGQWRIDYFKKEIEEISYEMPKVKARDKAQKLEDELYKISEKAEDLSALGDIIDKGLKDMEERVQGYKLNETGEQKEKGEYNE
jgi:hypothetical protein